ncbi:hypothetical protein [Emticicia sp. SJ17W-69]|uniref:hypothetical protein n=1 Tax=Emticicia sp. SJ17W-69 TaxID=3421657 RepID=UPI003EBC163E
MTKRNSRILTPIIPFIAIPATITGVYTMIYFNAPKQLWIINLTSVLIFSLLAFLFFKDRLRIKNINSKLILFLAIILLFGTFFNKGIDDVHRWLNFGSIKLNVGLIISPVVLLLISRETNVYYCCAAFTLVTILFLLQPDASLVTAFSISATILMIDKLKNKVIIIIFILLVLLSVAFSWYFLDNLKPANYVEDIMSLTERISPYLFIISLFSLFILVLPFFLGQFKKDKLIISLGCYFILLITSSFIGNFPVMIIGYGFSPIIGYFIGLILLIEKNKVPVIQL